MLDCNFAQMLPLCEKPLFGEPENAISAQQTFSSVLVELIPISNEVHCFVYLQYYAYLYSYVMPQSIRDKVSFPLFV